MFDEFQENQARCKVFANLKNAEHEAPCTSGSQNIWIAKFFACHLAGSSRDCVEVYGSSPDSMCQAGGDYADCVVVKNHSSCIGPIVV